MRHLLKDLGYLQLGATPIYEDNQACIKIAENDMVQARTKHINIRYHFSRQALKSGEVKLIYCPTELMLADALTKALCEVKFEEFAKSIFIQDTRSIRAGVLKIKQVLLDSCSSKRMQAEDKNKPLDQSSQPRTDTEASKQYSDSFPLISFKSQQRKFWNLGE